MNGFMYIDGQWRDAGSGLRKNVVNPATGEVVGTVPVANGEDIKSAINAADSAFKSWAKSTALERSNLLLSAYEKMVQRADDIAALLTREQGKPLKEARGEVLFAAEYLRWYSEEAKRNYGDTIPASAPHKRLIVIRQPIGVVAAITPWNFPAQMITRKIAPALAAGCTVVIKPADYTPLTAIALFQIFEEAGFPAGVVNLVTCPGSVFGKEILDNPKVKKITFTGSTEVGKYLLRGAADQVKRVSMELGGHAPFIVFEDADIDQAVEGCINSKFRNAGQTCVSANRIYVQDTVMDVFAEKLAERVKSLKIGDGMEPDVEIGPLINKEALEHVQKQVQDALSKGAQLLTGGKPWEGKTEEGAFYEPTIISHVNSTMNICYEETFGPVAPLISFAAEEEVIEQANNVDYGLAAYVFTRDLGRSFRVGEALEYGIIGVNDALPGVVQAPFGGWKESGLGVESGYYGMQQFLELKYMSIGLNNK